MKKINYIFLTLCLMAGISCTTMDNYEQPNSAFEGVMVDKGTGENIPLAMCDNVGKIQLLEINETYPNPEPYYVPVREDGVFSDNSLFASSYEATTFSMPVVEAEPVKFTTKAGETTEIKMEAIPYLRINAKVENDTLYFTINKPAEVEYDGDIIDIFLMYSERTRLDRNTCTQENGTMVGFKDPEGSSQAVVLGKEMKFPLVKFTNDIKTETILPGEYYFRAAARIKGAPSTCWNYCPAFKGVFKGTQE